MKFYEMYKAGLIEDPEKEILDPISEWHDGDSTETLPEYLGMTLAEYGMYVQGDLWQHNTTKKAETYFKKKSGDILNLFLTHTISYSEALEKLNSLRLEVNERILEAEKANAEFADSIKKHMEKK